MQNDSKEPEGTRDTAFKLGMNPSKARRALGV